MSSTKIILIAGVTAAVISGVAVKMFSHQQAAAVVGTQERDAIYNRVIASGKLNCGYVVYSPYFTKDPNTGKLGGIFYDLTNELGKRLHLEINWSLESGWATFAQDVSSGRVDAICSGLWADSAAARETGYSMPVLFAGVEAYVRADDTRFDNNMAAINSSDVRISTSDGSVSGSIGQVDFPKAAIVSLPNLTDYAQVIENVVTKKADVVFIETPKALEYLAHNPGKIKKIAPGDPVRVYRTVLALKQDEVRLKSMIDTTLQEMADSGFVEKTLEKHEPADTQLFYRLNKSYQTQGKN